MYNVYTGILKMLNEFQNTPPVEITYGLDDDYRELTEKYQISTVAKCTSSFNKIISLLVWLNSHTYYKGDCDIDIPLDAVSILDYAFNGGPERGINCRYLAIALTEILLAAGIKARSVYLMPFSPFDGDNHVVCEAWDEGRGKWIMIDPTYGCYVMDKDEFPLSICEIRAKLEEQEPMKLSDNTNYNGSSISERQVLEYYAKDFFYFLLHKRQGKTAEDSGEIAIVPNGFDFRRRMITNMEYRIRECGDYEGMQYWKKKISKEYSLSGLSTLKANG